MNWGTVWSGIGVAIVFLVQISIAVWCVATLSARLESIDENIKSLRIDLKEQGAGLWKSLNELWGKFNDCRAEHCAPAKVKHG